MVISNKTVAILLLVALVGAVCLATSCRGEPKMEKRDAEIQAIAFPPDPSDATGVIHKYHAPPQITDAIREADIERQAYLSPNWQWLIKNAQDHHGHYVVRSTESAQYLTADAQNLREDLLYYSMGEWNEDGTAFYARAASHPAKGCWFNAIVIYTLEDNQLAPATFFTPHNENEMDCLDAAWSPDGAYLAVTHFTLGLTYILNTKAEVIKTIPLALENYGVLRQIAWVGRKILLVTNYDITSTNSHAIIAIDIDSEEITILFDGPRAYLLLAIGPEQKIVINEYYYDKTEEKILLYNMQTGEIEIEAVVNGKVLSADVRKRPFIKLSVRDEATETNFCCWFADWESSELSYRVLEASSEPMSHYNPQNDILDLFIYDPKNPVYIFRP